MTDGTSYTFASISCGAEEAFASAVNLQVTSKNTTYAEHGRDADAAISLVGRSGKIYKALPIALDDLRIRDDQLCLLCVRTQHAEDVLWVGSGQSLVHDQSNRAEFMQVINKADKAYVIEIDDSAAQSLASWDLSNTHHNLPRAA